MTTAGQLNPPRIPEVERPRPLSLTASAQRLTGARVQRGGAPKPKEWQNDAFDMLDLVGELHYLATTLAGRMSQARFYVGKLAEDPSEDPAPVDDESLTSILGAVGSSRVALQQLVNRLGVNLLVAGEGWLVGIPKRLLPPSLLVGTLDSPEVQQPSTPPSAPPVGPWPMLGPAPLTPVDRGAPVAQADPSEPALLDSIDDLDWRMLSISEVKHVSAGQVVLLLGEGDADQVKASPDELLMIRVWRPHARYWWLADSPVNSSLPVLRELVGLTMHISAQVDSRLAGAGLLIVPQSASRALKVAAGLDEDSEEDPLIEAMLEAMIKPISDRASASAIVPLLLVVPDDVVDKFNHITFAKPLDAEARALRDEAIRRLALGLDAPPELLLGTAGMNHWGAWLVRDDVVGTHLEPPLATIADALTTQYLWPVLAQQGMAKAEYQQYVVWYDVSDLKVRPNRSSDAFALHERGAIDDEALRAATGFDDTDAPPEGLPLAVETALDLVRKDPSLMADPGLPQLVAQIQSVIEGNIPPVAVPTADDGSDQQAPAAPAGLSSPDQMPQTSEEDAEPEAGPSTQAPQPIAASAATATTGRTVETSITAPPSPIIAVN